MKFRLYNNWCNKKNSVAKGKFSARSYLINVSAVINTNMFSHVFNVTKEQNILFNKSENRSYI